MSVFKRKEIVTELLSKIGNGKIKVIAGVRRCGKTYLLDTLFYERLMKRKKYSHSSVEVVYLLGEHKDYRKESKLRTYLSSLAKDKKRIIMIDEVQEAKNFQKILTDFINDNPTVDLYVTGSNSNTLSSDIIDYFKELADTIYVEPLTYMEIKKEKKSYKLEDYLKYGGIPLVVNSDDKAKELEDIYKSVYQLDIKNRASKTAFQYLSTLDYKTIIDNLFSSQTPFSVNSIASKLCDSYGLDKKEKMNLRKDILNFIEIVEKSFLIHSFENDSDNKTPLERIGLNKKYYCCDCGLAYYLCSVAVHKLTVSLETAVFLHLKRARKNVTGKLLLDSRNGVRGEIDFNYDNKHVQVAYSLTDNNYDREIGHLLEINDSNEKIMVYVENISSTNCTDVKYVEASKFLNDSVSSL